MEYEKAKTTINDFIDAVNTIKLEALNSKVNRDARQKADDKIKLLEAEIKELKQYKRKFTTLSALSNVEICPQCDGYGGGADGDEFSGFQEWQCDRCEGACVVERMSVENGS
jgi:hypothetical protein